MKKIIAILCILILCISVIACERTDAKIHDALQGSWVAKWTAAGKNIERYYTFKGNTYTTGGTALFGKLETKTGRFEIRDSTIHLIPDDGSNGKDLDYTYNKDSGEITLWWNDDVQFQKRNVNVNY